MTDPHLTRHFLYAMTPGSQTSMSPDSPSAPRVTVMKEEDETFRIQLSSPDQKGYRRPATGRLTLNAASQMIATIHALHMR